MTTENQQMLEQLGNLTDAFHGEIANIEAARDAALGQVSNAIKAEMYYDALLDPTLTTNVANREFTTLDALLDAAPAGSLINARIAAGKVISMDSSAAINRSSVMFGVEGTGAAPVIKPGVFEWDNENRMTIISAYGDSHLYFFGVNIELPAKINAALGWRGDHSGFIRGQHGGSGLGVGFRASTISGSDVATSVVNPMLGGIVTVGMYQTTIDTVVAVGAAGSGAAVVAKNTLTLVNGGSVYSGGTSAGGNILEN